MCTKGDKYKILLVGDSVFDNVPYVDEGKDTVNALRRQLSPVATVDSVAVDGYTTNEVLLQLIKGVLKDRPKYDFIFLSIGGNDILVNQEVYLDPSFGLNAKRDFVTKVRIKFGSIYRRLREMSDHVYWLRVYTPYFDPNLFDDNYIRLANRAIHDVNINLTVGRNQKYVISTSSVLNKPEDFTEVIEPSAAGSEKLAKVLKRVVYDSLEGA
jgi:lysophospholipase L1-like esterase